MAEGQKVRATGVLTEEARIFGQQQRFTLGQIMVLTERYPEYHYGDQLEVVGEVQLIGRGYQLSYPKISLEAGNRGGFFQSGIISLRQKLRRFYQRSLPPPLAGLAAGVVLGDKSLIPVDFWQKLQSTGTLHLMVASGMNIALFSEGVLAFFCLFARKKPAIFFLLLTIGFYALLTGLAAPIVRAAIMAGLVYLAQLLGRQTQGWRVLLLAGGTMLLVKPVLLFDLGFQLSFLATLGLVTLQPVLKQVRFFLFQWEDFTASLSATLLTWPILLFNFGAVNPVSPIINLSVLWTVPYILKIGAVAGVLGLLWYPLGNWANYLLFPLLFYLQQVITGAAKIIRFQFELAYLPFYLIVIYYLLLWWGWRLTRKRFSV